MSDDYDFDDSFDASFLREVDQIAAKAAAAAPKGNTRTVSHPVSSFNKGWTGPQRSISSGSSNFRPGGQGQRPPPLPFTRPPITTTSTTTAATAKAGEDAPLSPRSKGAQARRLALMGLSAQPPTSSKPPGLGFKPVPKPGQPSARLPSTSTTALAPSRQLGRTSSGASGVQTHLNFRRENQTTKGKIWDRTAFAATGRKKVVKNKEAIDAQKKRKKGQAFDDDDDDEEDGEEDDWGEPLAPDPKSKVDLGKPYDPPKHLPDMDTVGTYIYPTNRPKRDYQYDIVMACFTDNCLVALPTGLGKTFVAGVVMLNFYRWFPTGKIVFLAPTKPLVNQQIEACQMTCGIPSKDAAVMTGSSVSAKERTKLWQERRVFYCTPQTMYNDLQTGRLDPRDIVLAVFDEAHKASGSYAYTTILAYLTAHQPHFRVLALTATPGADVPKVQGVVDALHISRIEIREAEDPAISKYMNEKKTEQHVVPMSDVIGAFRDRWATLMRPMVQKLVDKGVLVERDLDAKRLKPFRLTAKRMEISRDRTSGQKWALGILGSLEHMARAMTHLLEFSLGMFRTTLIEIAGNTSQETGKKSGSKGNSNAMRNNLEFQKLLRDVESEINLMRIGAGGRGRSEAHPKMGKTLELLLAHFTQAQDDEDVHGVKNDTRAMVFCSFRHCVLEVVDMLNDHPDLLKATKFVGQSQGKQENDKGFNQKEQKKTIMDFKEGKHNILVSTSIGEEGLDIGEVDFVIIYDMPKQSIKLLQRIGRTGRKRSGQVHVLMSENREDLNWDSAQQTHREIQEEILHSRNLELFEDVERLLPVGPFPKCEEKIMPVDPWDPEDQKRKIIAISPKSKAAAKAKEKEEEKNRQRGDAIPDAAGSGGFKSVSDLLREQGRSVGVKGKGKGLANTTGAPKRKKDRDIVLDVKEIPKKKRKVVGSPIRSLDGEDAEENDGDEDEALRELLYGNVGAVKKVKKATGAGKVAAAGEKGKAKKVVKGKTAKGKGKEKAESEGEMDVDENIKEPEESPEDIRDTIRKEEEDRRRRDASTDRKGLDFFNFSGPTRLGPTRPRTPEITPPSSPIIPKRINRPPLEPRTDNSKSIPNITSGKLSPTTAKLAGFSQLDALDFAWDSDDNDDGSGLPIVKTQEMQIPAEEKRASVVVDDEEETMIPSGAPIRRIGLSRSQLKAPIALGPSRSTIAMPPPVFPHTRTSSPAVPLSKKTTPTIDQTQFPVRKIGVRRARVIMSSSEKGTGSGPAGGGGSGNVSSPLPTGPGVRMDSDLASSPVISRRARQKGKGKVPRAQVQEYLDVDVQISGSESSDESSPDEEDESDRRFAGKNFAPTQAPKGYNQRAMYMAGLSTQTGHVAGLGFKKRVDEEGFLAKARKPVLLTDSEGEGEEGGLRPRGAGGIGGGSEDSENEYEMGSFVVQDDEDLGFDDVGEESF